MGAIGGLIERVSDLVKRATSRDDRLRLESKATLTALAATLVIHAVGVAILDLIVFNRGWGLEDGWPFRVLLDTIIMTGGAFVVWYFSSYRGSALRSWFSAGLTIVGVWILIAAVRIHLERAGSIYDPCALTPPHWSRPEHWDIMVAVFGLLGALLLLGGKFVHRRFMTVRKASLLWFLAGLAFFVSYQMRYFGYWSPVSPSWQRLALDEQPFMEPQAASNMAETYRFTLLRSFIPEFVQVEVEVLPDGSGQVHTEWYQWNANDQQTGRRKLLDRKLSAGRMKRFLARVETSKFWETSPDQLWSSGLDGSDWKFEGWRVGNTNTLTAWAPTSPQPGDSTERAEKKERFHQLGLEFLALSRARICKGAIH